VLINGDTINEPDELIHLLATPTTNSAYLAAGATARTATVTILNDDTAPDFEVTSVSGAEGETVEVFGTVTGTRQGDAQVAVNFVGGSSEGSVAASANDFTSPGFVIVNIPSNTTSGSIIKITDLVLLADALDEPAETIIASGSGINNSATVTEGIVTIEASDGTDPTDPTDPPVDPTDPGEPNVVTLESISSFQLGAGTMKLNGTATPGSMVQPFARPLDSDGDLVAYGDPVEADEDGNFSFNGVFTKVGYDFSAGVGDDQSEIIRVNLKEDPTLLLRSYSKGYANLTVVGDPRVAGLRVRFTRMNSDGTYTTVGTGLLDSAGVYRRTLSGMTSGKAYYFKAAIYGDGDVGLLTNTTAAQRIVLR
jgi:hypothetical protein